MKIIQKISELLGYIIFSFSILLYVSTLIHEPFEKVSTVGLSAFALVAAVSGLCFAMAQVLESKYDKTTALYAGEKLSLSAVLIMETIVLKYGSDAALSSSYIKSFETLNTSIIWISHGLTIIISSYAAGFFLYGFEALHDFLWNRFDKSRMGQCCPKGD